MCHPLRAVTLLLDVPSSNLPRIYYPLGAKQKHHVQLAA